MKIRNKVSNRFIKIIVTVLLTVLIIIPQTGCGAKGPFNKSEFCLDTSCNITIYDEMSEDEAMAILDEAYAQIREYENTFSKTIEGSDVYKVNEAKGAKVEISDATMELVKIGSEMGELSDGAFDITIGAASSLWDFKSENPEVPKESDIKEALKTVDYTQLGIEGNKFWLEDEGAKLDFGGVAKGYIADRTGEFLESKGVTKAIVDLGGNIVTIGDKEEGTPWKVGIERPYSDRTEIIGAVEAVDQTVVTSGIYERQFIKDGKRYHHILDPETGYSSDSDIEAITIMAAKGNSGFCDALSTACLILGQEDALQLIKTVQNKHPEMGVKAAIINKNDEIIKTEGMEIISVE